MVPWNMAGQSPTSNYGWKFERKPGMSSTCPGAPAEGTKRPQNWCWIGSPVYLNAHNPRNPPPQHVGELGARNVCCSSKPFKEVNHMYICAIGCISNHMMYTVDSIWFLLLSSCEAAYLVPRNVHLGNWTNLSRPQPNQYLQW